jgi:hypothetical protein
VRYELDFYILSHVRDPLLGNDCEISKYTRTVTQQQQLNYNNEERCLLSGPCRDVLSGAGWKLQLIEFNHKSRRMM